MLAVMECDGQRYTKAEREAAKRSRRRCPQCKQPVDLDGMSTEQCMYSEIACFECDRSPCDGEHL